MSEELKGKRVLVLGAETELGQAIARAAAEAGADVAAVAAVTAPEAAFAVQRLARRLSAAGGRALAQAIDATNEMAVRVMVRQVGKQLGGLDAVVVSTIPFGADEEARERGLQAGQLVVRFASKEFTLRGGGVFVAVDPLWAHPAPLTLLLEVDIIDSKKKWPLRVIAAKDLSVDAVMAEALRAVAAGPDNR